MASSNNEILAEAHREEHEISEAMHQLELKRRALHRVPTNVLRDDECIRHDIHMVDGGRHVLEFKYHQGVFHVMGGIYPSLNSVTQMHYKMVRPDRVHQNNAWAGCEVRRHLVNDIWVSMENLPLLSLAN